MKPTILCVDDEQIVRDSLRDQLKRAFAGEARVETAEDADDALEILKELLEDGVDVPVIISDHIMPGMKGDELLIAVHELVPTTRTILLTGQASADAVGNAVNRARLYRYLGKPWDSGDLRLTVREAMHTYFQDVDLRRKSEAFFRFVPKKFLELLGVDDSFHDVRLGMGVERDMGVLFSDIREFTTLCEGMTPAECVAFVNAYMGRMEEAIGAHNGFIEGFTGDGIMAMFAGSAADAIHAGVAMHDSMRRYNVERAANGQVPLKMGVGVNAGKLTLGTIGAPGRLKCGVAGDPVNTAARVESLTKHYGVKMLITDEAAQRLPDDNALTLRRIDRVVVKGRTKPVQLFEVLEAADPDVQETKRKTLATYQEALDRYYDCDFFEAGRLFAECLVVDPGDDHALTFMARCHRHRQEGVPEDWTGVEHLVRK